MRLLVKPKTVWSAWTGITRPAALGLGVLLLGLAGPALGGHEAPAVWVPLPPGQLADPGARVLSGTNPPIVLVPYQKTHNVPDSGQRPDPWVPDYLLAPGPGLRDGAVRSRPLLGDGRRVEPSPQNRRRAGRAPSFTLSDVLRDVDWRRQTAKRLRQEPSFKPRF